MIMPRYSAIRNTGLQPSLGGARRIEALAAAPPGLVTAAARRSNPHRGVIGGAAGLATDPLERVVVVVKDGAPREAPLAVVLFDQFALVAAGRKGAVAVVL